MGARLRDIATGGRRDVIGLDPTIIKIQPEFNPRNYTLFDNRQHLDDLKRSIAEIGVITPLIVRWDGEQAVVIDGECRLRACLELIKEGLPIKSVPVLQESASDDAARLVVALTANTGKPLTLLEAGGAYKRLQRFGWTIEQIATKTGATKAKVAMAIEIADAPQDVKEMVSNGSVTPSLAKQVVRQKGDNAAAVLVKKVSDAKAAGKKKAVREKAPSKAKTAMEELLETGDEMALTVLKETEQDSPIWRSARKWQKLRTQ